MSGIHLPCVDWLLDYEITLSARHRRFVTLVMIGTDKTPEELDQVLSEAIRNSDMFFPGTNGLSVVMGETASAEAINAIDRYKRTVNGSMNLHYSMASYPSDGKTMAEIKHVAQRRLEKAKTCEIGAVVAEG